MTGTEHGADQKAQRFEGWVRQHGPSILRTCFVYLADKSLAEDATQDTFLKAWKHMERQERQSIENEKAWLMRIAINVCHDYHRSRWFRYADTERALEELPSRYLLTDPEDRTLLLDIMRLPEKQKQVILLYYYQGMTLEEVGSVLGISAATAHYRLKKAEAALKTVLTGGSY